MNFKWLLYAKLWSIYKSTSLNLWFFGYMSTSVVGYDVKSMYWCPLEGGRDITSEFRKNTLRKANLKALVGNSEGADHGKILSDFLKAPIIRTKSCLAGEREEMNFNLSESF